MLADSMEAVLNQAGPFSFTAGPSATLAVTAQATDGYRVYAQRSPSGGTLFSISKQLSTSMGIDGGLGLTLSIADDSLDSLVHSVFAQAGAIAQSDLESLLQSSTGGLSAQQTTTLSTPSSINWGSQTPSSRSSRPCKARFSTFKDRRHQPPIALTISAQFTYSWKRLTADSLVRPVHVAGSG